MKVEEAREPGLLSVSNASVKGSSIHRNLSQIDLYRGWEPRPFMDGESQQCNRLADHILGPVAVFVRGESRTGKAAPMKSRQ